MANQRRPAVAGTFYPGDAEELRDLVGTYLQSAKVRDCRPKAMIAPHAGFVYSGPIAASAYAQIAPSRDVIRRVVLVGRGGNADRDQFRPVSLPRLRLGPALGSASLKPLAISKPVARCGPAAAERGSLRRHPDFPFASLFGR